MHFGSSAHTIISDDSESFSGGILQKQDAVLRNINFYFFFAKRHAVCHGTSKYFEQFPFVEIFSVSLKRLQAFLCPKYKEEWYMENEIIEKHF